MVITFSDFVPVCACSALDDIASFPLYFSNPVVSPVVSVPVCWLGVRVLVWCMVSVRLAVSVMVSL